MRDHNGHTVWRVRVAAREERTHRKCGETLIDGGFCHYCGVRPPASEIIRTVDFLKEGEYEIA